MSDVIKVKLVPTWDLYPKTTSDYRVYSCTTRDIEAPIKFNQYGDFVINGEMQELELGEEYDAELQEVQHPRHGLGYKVLRVYQELPQTVEGQYAFLKTIINENYAEAIRRAYPNEINIIQLIRDGELDYSKIKGIGDSVFERIKQSVNENFELQDVIVELSPLGVTNTIIRKLVAHYDDNASLVLQKIKKNIYILCEEVSGIGFKKVDEYALNKGVPEDSPYRINACIEYILGKEEGNGHCWIERDELIECVMNETDLEYKIISEHLKSDSFKQDKRFYSDDWRIGLYRNYYYENKIADFIIELTNKPTKTIVENLEKKIKAIEEQQGFEFTDEQIEAIRESVNNNVVLISGKAGSGKSSVLKGIIGVLNDYTYETCSLSGKASQRIIEATGLSSKTVHRLLGYNISGGVLYDRDNPLPHDSIALDEASMVNNLIFYKLSSAIKEDGKLIILGDIEQLASMGAGAVFLDMIKSGVLKVCELTKVHRQAQKSGILSYANKVRDGLQINDRGDYENKTVGELQDLTLIPFERKPDIASHIIDICKKIKDRIDLNEFQVIVPMKERGNLSVKNLNIELQAIFNPSKKEGLKRNGYEFKAGDKIIKRGNDYEAANGKGVFNGTLGRVEWVDLKNKRLAFKFLGIEELVVYSQEEMKESRKGIDMAYALTVHSNQGSQYKNVICALDYSAYKLLSRQLVYTMLTRASCKCMFLFENEALRYAINNNETERNTFLQELLQLKSIAS